MKLFTLLASIDPAITPHACKVYLHQPVRDRGVEAQPWMYPLDMWKDGTFEEFQSFQTTNHFTAEYLVSLIYNDQGGYMFAGVFRRRGMTAESGGFSYHLERLPDFDELDGRLHVLCSEKNGRTACYLGATLADRLSLQTITEHKLGTPEFPGYRSVRVRKADLDRIIKAQDVGWRGPLSKVKGIYLISDMAKNLVYVGMASGANGFWGRWSCYSRSGHGGNRKMIKLLDELSDGHAENFVFSILEIADLNTSDESLEKREIHWKELLHTRVSLNGN
jgi:hypothetical protein